VKRDELLNHREMGVFLAPFGELNTMYMGWGGDLSNAFDYMRNDKENFFPYTLIVPYPVARLEAERETFPPRGLLSVRLRQGDFLEKTDSPERLVTAYGRSDAYLLILEGIRQKLTQHLLGMLPRAVLNEEN
jgi:hypothetical protein